MSSKPLSEQVAELEDERNSWMYRAEAEAKYARDLKSSAYSLMIERDELKADAISDLITRRWLETQVRSREAERDDLQRQVQEARDEIAALREGQGEGFRTTTDARRINKWNGLCAYLGVDPDEPISAIRDTAEREAAENLALRAERDDLQRQGRRPGETVASEDVPFKGTFTTLLKAKKTEDERARKIRDAWQAAFAEVYFGEE